MLGNNLTLLVEFQAGRVHSLESLPGQQSSGSCLISSVFPCCQLRLDGLYHSFLYQGNNAGIILSLCALTRVVLHLSLPCDTLTCDDAAFTWLLPSLLIVCILLVMYI